MQQAEDGIRELEKHVDSLIVIPNDRLRALDERKKTIAEAFAEAEKIDLLEEFKNEVAQNEEEIRDWLDAEFANNKLTKEQCNYWLMLINTKN